MSHSQTAAEDASQGDCVPAPHSLAGPPAPKRARVGSVAPAGTTPVDWSTACSGVPTSPAHLPRPNIVLGVPVAETAPHQTKEDTFLYHAQVPVITLGAPWCRPSGLTRPPVDAADPASVRDGLCRLHRKPAP